MFTLSLTLTNFKKEQDDLSEIKTLQLEHKTLLLFSTNNYKLMKQDNLIQITEIKIQTQELSSCCQIITN